MQDKMGWLVPVLSSSVAVFAVYTLRKEVRLLKATTRQASLRQLMQGRVRQTSRVWPWMWTTLCGRVCFSSAWGEGQVCNMSVIGEKDRNVTWAWSFLCACESACVLERQRVVGWVITCSLGWIYVYECDWVKKWVFECVCVYVCVSVSVRVHEYVCVCVCSRLS